MKIVKGVTIILGFLLLTGCGDAAPFHKVYGTEAMVVYKAEAITSDYGSFEYWITDGTGKGWTLRTDDKFAVGDKIVISKKRD